MLGPVLADPLPRQPVTDPQFPQLCVDRRIAQPLAVIQIQDRKLRILGNMKPDLHHLAPTLAHLGRHHDV